MSIDKYILEGHEPKPVDDLLEWGRWFETADRRVDQTEIGPYFISTVFLGLDYDYTGKGPPMLFETMVFVGGDEVFCARCSTWDEAVKQHQNAVSRFQAAANG